LAVHRHFNFTANFQDRFRRFNWCSRQMQTNADVKQVGIMGYSTITRIKAGVPVLHYYSMGKSKITSNCESTFSFKWTNRYIVEVSSSPRRTESFFLLSCHSDEEEPLNEIPPSSEWQSEFCVLAAFVFLFENITNTANYFVISLNTASKFYFLIEL
jgi:hypothetical protein